MGEIGIMIKRLDICKLYIKKQLVYLQNVSKYKRRLVSTINPSFLLKNIYQNIKTLKPNENKN